MLNSTFQLVGCMRAPWHMSSGSLNSSPSGGAGCYSSVASIQPVFLGGRVNIEISMKLKRVL